MKNAIPAWYSLTYTHMEETAHEFGYALGLHGSLNRDLDIIAVPWTVKAIPAKELIEKFVERSGLIKIEPQGAIKPHGRLCFSLGLGGDSYIDLSILPITDKPCDKCNGSGEIMGFPKTFKCGECHGSGLSKPPVQGEEK